MPSQLGILTASGLYVTTPAVLSRARLTHKLSLTRCKGRGEGLTSDGSGMADRPSGEKEVSDGPRCGLRARSFVSS